MKNYKLKKLKLVYSFGLKQSCENHLNDIEHFIDIKTLKEFDTQPYIQTKVIIGKFNSDGIYIKPNISIYELHEKYIRRLYLYKNEDIVIEELFREYNFIPLTINKKYPNRYYSPDYV